MDNSDIRMARIYLTESGLGKLLSRLHDEEKVQGVTAFRGIAGFGKSGKMHSSSLLDLSLDMPVIVEFFDTDERISKILSNLESDFEPGHIVTWQAKVNS